MVLSAVTIKVDPHKWELFTSLYPLKSSKRIREFIDATVESFTDEEKNLGVDELQQKIQEQILIEKNAQIKRDALLSRISELEEQAQESQSKLLTGEELEWLGDTGVSVLENRGIAESYKSFQNVFKRFDYPFTEYKRQISTLMRESEAKDDTSV